MSDTPASGGVRPRTVPRVLQFPLVRMAIVFVAIVLIAVPVLAGVRAFQLHGMAAAMVHLAAGLVAWGIYAASVRLLEGRAPTETAIGNLVPRFVKGFGIGVALFGGTVLILWLCGAYGVEHLNTAAALPAVFVNALGAAVLEEIAVRGVLFRNIEQALGTWPALVLSAGIFGLLHAFNRGANWRDMTGIALEGGLLLAAAYVYARELWICIGLHCAWNFNDGGVFGASGSTHSLIAAGVHGPDWLTGGASGLDASMVAVLVCLAATVVFLRIAKRRGRIVGTRWRSRPASV